MSHLSLREIECGVCAQEIAAIKLWTNDTIFRRLDFHAWIISLPSLNTHVSARNEGKADRAEPRTHTEARVDVRVYTHTHAHARTHARTLARSLARSLTHSLTHSCTFIQDKQRRLRINTPKNKNNFFKKRKWKKFVWLCMVILTESRILWDLHVPRSPAHGWCLVITSSVFHLHSANCIHWCRTPGNRL